MSYMFLLLASEDSNLLFTLLAGAFGGSIISLVITFINNQHNINREKRDIKEFLWKEKIESSKKASEYYLEILNYFNVLITHFELLLDNEVEISGLNEKILFYEKRLENFNNYEHHHINIFYDLFSDEAKEVSVEINKLFHKIEIQKLNAKPENLENLLNELKNCYIKLENLYKNQFNMVRNNINSFIR